MTDASLCPGRRVLDGDRGRALEKEGFSLRWQPSAHQRLFLHFHVVLRGMTLIPKECTSAPDSAVHSLGASLPSWACSGCLAGEWDVAKGQSSWTLSQARQPGKQLQVAGRGAGWATSVPHTPPHAGDEPEGLGNPGTRTDTRCHRACLAQWDTETPQLPQTPTQGCWCGQASRSSPRCLTWHCHTLGSEQGGCRWPKQPKKAANSQTQRSLHPLLLSTSPSSRDLRKQAGMLINI